MQYQTIGLQDYVDKISSDPFDFTGEGFLIVPRRLVGSEIFGNPIDEIDTSELGELEEIPEVSGLDYREATFFYLNILNMFNSRIRFLINSSI